MKLSIAQFEEYLSHRLQNNVQVLNIQVLGDRDVAAASSSTNFQNNDSANQADTQSLKAFGYGEPVLIEYQAEGEVHQVVFHTASPNHFGHELRADRAAEMLLSYDTYNSLPKHTPAVDLGVITRENHLLSLADSNEFFLITDYVDGEPYAHDLQRLRDTGDITGLDLRRARHLALYLVQIHATKRDDPALYVRRIRDTLGSGEGIMGLTDSYPPNSELATPAWLEQIEKLCVTWRWRLKERTGRLAQVHGDFHPFNILFDRDTQFHLLDRSRGAWGEPADDVVCMVINYLFFSLQRSGKLAPPFEQLWNIFWNTYLSHTRDPELLTVAAPFFAWRALVLASPVWYNVTDSVRHSLLNAAETVLRNRIFDPAQINTYIE